MAFNVIISINNPIDTQVVQFGHSREFRIHNGNYSFWGMQYLIKYTRDLNPIQLELSKADALKLGGKWEYKQVIDRH